MPPAKNYIWMYWENKVLLRVWSAYTGRVSVCNAISFSQR